MVCAFLALALLADSGRSYYVHINDNDGRGDWDYFCGAKHFLEYVAFLYYLKQIGYKDYLTSDTSPARRDVKGIFEASSRLTNKIWALLDACGPALEKSMAKGDYLETWKIIKERNLLLEITTAPSGP